MYRRVSSPSAHRYVNIHSPHLEGRWGFINVTEDHALARALGWLRMCGSTGLWVFSLVRSVGVEKMVIMAKRKVCLHAPP